MRTTFHFHLRNSSIRKESKRTSENNFYCKTHLRFKLKSFNIIFFSQNNFMLLHKFMIENDKLIKLKSYNLYCFGR